MAKKAMGEIFQAHLVNLNMKRAHKETNQDSNSEGEIHNLEESNSPDKTDNFIKEIYVSENLALAALHQPAKKCQRLNTYPLSQQ